MIDFVALANRKAFRAAQLGVTPASEVGTGPNSGVDRAESGGVHCVFVPAPIQSISKNTEGRAHHHIHATFNGGNYLP